MTSANVSPTPPNTFDADIDFVVVSRSNTAGGTFDNQPGRFTVKVAKDVTALAPPVITSPANNSTTNSSTVTVSGTAEANSTVELFDGPTSKGTTQADASGNWSKELTGVADGPHPYTAKAKDAAGNTSGPSPPVLVTVQRQQDTSLAVDAASGTYGGTTTLSATLTKTSDGTGIGDKTIVFSLRGSAVCDNDTADATKPDCPKTNTSGVATLNNVSLSGIDAGGPTGTGYENAVSANFAADSGFKASNGSNSLTVNPKQITITPDSGQSKVYGQLDPTLAYTASSPLESGDSYTGKLGRATGENVGNYAINLGTLTAGANYDLKHSATPVNFAITARSITVTPDANQSKVYGDADPVLTFHLAAGSSLAFNDTLADATDGAPSRAQGENVGTYTIQQGTLTAAADNNYELHFDANGVTFAITPKAITVTADNKTKQLGATDPALTYQVTSGSLVQGDSFTGSLSRVAGENVGTYAIQQGSLSAGNNYTLTFKEGTLTIVYAGGFLGITQPINGGMGESIALTANSVGAGADPDFADDNSRFKLGSTVPVKFQLKDANGALVTNASAQLYLKQADSKPDPGVDEPISTAASTTGNLFRYDAMSGQYIFNLSTKNSSYTNPDGKVVPLAQGTYTISVKLDDNTYRSVNIQLVR